MPRTLRLGLTLLLATVALAGDVLDPTIAVPLPVKGERLRVQFAETIAQRLERTMEGMPKRMQKTVEKVDACWLEEVLEVTPSPVVRVTFERWRRTTRDAEATPDQQLEGRVVVIRGATQFALEPPEPPVTGAALRFLERVAERVAAPSAPLDVALRPSKAVARGDVWDATTAAAGLVPGAPFTEVAPEGSRVGAVLLRLEGGKATVELVGDLQLRNAPGTTDRFTEGGLWQVHAKATFSPPGRPSQDSYELGSEVEGKTEGKLPDGRPYTSAVRLVHTVWTTVERLTK